MGPRWSHLIPLICFALLLEGCTLIASSALAPEGAREVVGEAMRLNDRASQLVGIGYAVVSVQNHSNPEQRRLLAIRSSKLDAYRSLAEQVFGQYLDADTTIGEMMIEDDRFRARVEGVIYGDDSYQTTLSLEQHVVNDIRALYMGYFAQTGNPS